MVWYGMVEVCEGAPVAVSGSKYVCGYSWTSTLLAVGITPTTTTGFSKVAPLYQRNLLGGHFISEDPLHGGVRRS